MLSESLNHDFRMATGMMERNVPGLPRHTRQLFTTQLQKPSAVNSERKETEVSPAILPLTLTMSASQC
jgi:hypothetical protein